MSKESNSSGIGILGLLGVAFVVLKLCKVIDWSWWWVTCPFWGGFAILILLLLFALFVSVLNNKKSENPFGGRVGKKSSFQARLEEMQKQRESLKNNSNLN